MSFALLNGTIGNFEQLRLESLNGAAADPQGNEGGSLGREDGIRAAIDAVHEVLDRC